MEGFTALSYGNCILFGLQEKAGCDPPGLAKLAIWQIGTEDVGQVHKLCEHEGHEIIQAPELQELGEWILTVRSPNGYTVLFEGPKCGSEETNSAR